MNAPTETAEEFIPLPIAGAATAPTLRTFQGKPLAPFDEGVRSLLVEAATGLSATHHWMMMLVFLLIDLQESIDKYRQTGQGAHGTGQPMSEEDAHVAATAGILTILGDNPRTFQARAIRRTSKLGVQAAKEAILLAEDILKEAEAAEAAEEAKPAKEAAAVAA